MTAYRGVAFKRRIAAADSPDVTSPLHPLDRTAWLYTRADASVAMTVDDHDDGFTLVIRGPGRSGATHEFATPEELATFVHDRELHLLADGFQLQAVVERRRDGNGPDRAHGLPDRRRR
jgi:hypothetical protein